MRKIVLAFFMCVATLQVDAQSFTTEADTVKGTISSDLNLHNNITNTSSAPIKITWRVIDSDFPASWKLDSLLGICDNMLCRNNANNQLFTQAFTSMDYEPNQLGDLHLQLTNFEYSHVVSGSHYITMELKEGSNVKNVTFIVAKFATGVSSVAKSADKIVMYPNPAQNELNVIFDRDMDIANIGVYNLIGKAVTIYKVNGNSAKLNIANMPSGIYFARLCDSQGRIVATRKFIHE